MRSLIVTLYAKKPISLPIAYNEYIQGALYGCWREKYPHIHGENNNSPSKFKMFTFSSLRGKYRVKNKQIFFEDEVSFELRSPVEEYIEEVAIQLSRAGQLRFASQVLPLVNLQSCDRLLFPQRALIQMKTPLTIHASTNDNHTIYITPDDREFIPRLQANAFNKCKEFGLTENMPFDILPLRETFKKRVTTFKGVYITAWLGSCIVSTNAELLALLYHIGLGDRNSQGFGMFNIANKPI